MSLFKSYPVQSANQCVAYCMSNPTCRSFNVRIITPITNGVNAKMCELSVKKMDGKSGDDDEWRHNSVEDEESDMYFMTSSPKRPLHFRQVSTFSYLNKMLKGRFRDVEAK